MHKKELIKTKSILSRPEQKLFDKFSIYYYLILLIICFAVHSQTLTFDYTHFDDDSIIINKQQFLSNLQNIPEAFRRDATLDQPRSDFYRPLQTVTYILDCQISKNKPFAYHLTNLLIYCFTCTIILLLLRKLFPAFPGLMLFVLVLLFSMNPFLVQAVAWIPARGDLLLALFSVGSFILLLKFNENKKPIFLLFHFLLFILALFSKETAVMIPLVFLSFIIIGKKKQAIIRQIIPILFVWIACIAIYLMIRSTAIGNNSKIPVQFVQLLSNLLVIPETLAKFIFPFQLSPIPTFTLLFSLIGFIISGLILWRLLSKRNNRLIILQGFAWFVFLSLPAMAYNNKALGGYDYLSHRCFLPLVGSLIILVAVLPQEWKRLKAFWGVSALTAITFLLISINYSKIFSEPMVFCNAAIKANQTAPNAFIARASLKTDRGDIQGAIVDYNRALMLCPSNQIGLMNRANILAEIGDTQSAFIDFATIMHINPAWAKPYLDRGKWRLGAGNLTGAKYDFDRAITLDSCYSDAYNNVGTFYLIQNDTATAEKYYLKALSFNKYHLDALYNYGLIRLWKKDLAEACESWKLAASYGSRPAQDALVNHCNY